MTTHLFIPDPQCKPDVPLDHLRAAGNYIVEKQPDVIINIGDHWDFPSLSQYEQKGSKYWEGKRIREDIDAGLEGMRQLLGPLWNHQKKHSKWKKRPYKPRLVFTAGNHEHRLVKFLEENPQLEGMFGLENLKIEEFGWEYYPFLEPVTVDGITYCHYFCNPDSAMGNPVGGTIENRLNKLGITFSQGHEQTYKTGITYDALGRPIRGLVLGAFYQHDEGYRSIQKNRQHWRGIIYKYEVGNGDYLMKEVGLDYLMKNYL